MLGVGPWQSGTIYDGTRFAGDNISEDWSMQSDAKTDRAFRKTTQFADYCTPQLFDVRSVSSEAEASTEGESVVPASGESAPSEGSGAE